MNASRLFSIRSATHRANVSGWRRGVLGSVCRVVSCRGCLPALADVVDLLWSLSTCCFLVLLFDCCCNSNVTFPSAWLTSRSQSRELPLTGCRVPGTPRPDQIWAVKVASVSPCCTVVFQPCMGLLNLLFVSVSALRCCWNIYVRQMRYTHPGRNQRREMLN